MCSHYISERRRAYFLRHYGIVIPADWEAPAGTSHVYPTQLAPIIRRPAARESGDEAVPEFEAVMARFGLLPGFAKDIKYGTRTYNARSETVPEAQYAEWLDAPAERSKEFMTQYLAERLVATPQPVAPKAGLARAKKVYGAE